MTDDQVQALIAELMRADSTRAEEIKRELVAAGVSFEVQEVGVLWSRRK